MSDLINRQDTIKAVDEAFQMGDCYCDKFAIKGLLNSLPSIESMTIHEVAIILAELFDDPCACNYNGIDEWLPEKCEFEDACPYPGGVTCWEQYLKYQLEKIRE